MEAVERLSLRSSIDQTAAAAIGKARPRAAACSGTKTGAFRS